MKHILLAVGIFAFAPAAVAQTWTWPGNLSQHLRQHGLTHADLKSGNLVAKHDRIHNTVRRGYPLRSDVQYVRSSSVCPRCGRVHRQFSSSASVSAASRGSDVAAAWGNPALIQQAIASARYRAQRGIRGHCSIDTSHRGFRMSGVGWATGNRTPRTCYSQYMRSPNAAYASVRGRGGYYSTLLIR